MNNSQEKFVGQYQILKQVGRGQNGLVFQVKPPSTDRMVALKLYPSALLQGDFSEQFSHDLARIKSLTHPHIVRIYTYGQTDKFPSIVMRYVDGGNLATRIQAGITTLSELEEPLHQICQALDYAHEQGVIHGNLKPSNILFDQDGKAYVSDFGIEAIMQNRPIESPYIAPEQVNQIIADERSDVYALGMVLFEWITGKAPFWADSFLSKDGQKNLPSIRIYRPEASPMLDDVIQQATAQNPAIRFGSIKEFFRAFIKALHDTTRINESVRSHPLTITDFSDTTKYDFSKIQEKPQKPSLFQLMALLVLVFVVTFGITVFVTLISYNASTYTYQPAIIPEGYVLYSGKDVEIAAPSWWININTPEYVNMILQDTQSFEGQVSPEIYQVMSQMRSSFESGKLQILTADPAFTTSLNILVTEDVEYAPIEEVKSYLEREYDRIGIEVIEAVIVQIPVGEAIYLRFINPAHPLNAESNTYMVLMNNKSYTLTFTPSSATDAEIFSVMIDTFRIKS